uniref:O-fucosyltransferase 14-like n=1 Tax=Erigeron canadensis TaxID=72917 RepID=UPI001CB94EFB|nr:O-fucosyltransferase 14-like [Erigeron canadensis]
MERECSDEEEDRRHLISPKSPQRRASIFQIDDSKNNNSASGSGSGSGIMGNYYYLMLKKKKTRYILAITLPLLLFIVVFIYYFTSDFKSLFGLAPPAYNNNNEGDMMRESELQALNLLKRQQSGLVALWNHSDSSGFIKSRLLDQISLNNKIQNALLSSHHYHHQQPPINNNNNLTPPPLCPKVDQNFSQRRTLPWNPNKDKYLFAICTSGQMSNHLICLEKHMFFAALLDRILVIPSSKVDYEFTRVLDIDHINLCVGRQVVIPFEDFPQRNKNRMRIDQVLCYFSLPQPCYVDDDHLKKLKALGVSITTELNTVWTEDVKKPTHRTIHEVTEKFSSNADVLAIGDVFFADVEKRWVEQPGGPIAHKCQTLIEPSRVILLTAQRFIQTFLGDKFIALHFRRHGFLKFCNAKNPSCFFPIPQAAECITRLVERANIPVIYLSTDAAESETGLLQSLITLNGKTVPLITRPARNSAEKWDALLYRKKLDGDPQVEAMLDKTISALSAVFIGAPGSTFTEDILRLRRGWGTASVCDEYLCQGEVPNFIAGDE